MLVLRFVPSCGIMPKRVKHMRMAVKSYPKRRAHRTHI